MAVYEFKCAKCGRKFTAVLRIAELERSKRKVRCPKCSSSQVTKCIEPFFAVTSKKS